MPTIYATINPIILSYSLCYSITVFANDLWYCPFYNFIMLCCPLYFITAATFRHQFFPPKLPHWDFPPYSPFHHHGEGGGGDNVTVFQTEATPWDGKGGGKGGLRIRGRTFMILERPTSISRSQVGGGEGRQGLRDTNLLALVLIRVCTLELAWVVEGGDPDRVCKIPSFNYECAFMWACFMGSFFPT